MINVRATGIIFAPICFSPTATWKAPNGTMQSIRTTPPGARGGTMTMIHICRAPPTASPIGRCQTLLRWNNNAGCSSRREEALTSRSLLEQRKLEPPTPRMETGRDAFHRVPELCEDGDAVERVPTAPYSGALWRTKSMRTRVGCYATFYILHSALCTDLTRRAFF